MITIQAKALNVALTKLSKIPNKKVGVLDGMALLRAENNQFHIRKTDLDIDYRVTLACDSSESWDCIVANLKILRAALKAHKRQTVTLDYRQDKLIVNESIVLPVQDSEDYPVEPTVNGSATRLSLREFTKSLRQIAYAASHEDSQNTLSCIAVDSERIWACDGHRLASRANPGIPECLLRINAVKPLLKIFQSEKDFPAPEGNVTIGEEYALFDFGQECFFVYLAQAKYPPVRSVIPNVEPISVILFEREGMLSALDPIIAIASDKHKCVALTVKRDKIKIEHSNADCGNLSTVLNSLTIVKSASIVNVAFNVFYLTEMLKTMQCHFVTWFAYEGAATQQLQDQKAACEQEGTVCAPPSTEELPNIFMSEEESGLPLMETTEFHLIMPMRQ